MATFRMAPMVSGFGRDSYRGGIASMDMRFLSLVPVAKKTGGGLNQGDPLRFLGEMQWFPAAAVSECITWEAVDDTTATATMRYGGVAASMTLTFGPDGRLLEERASRPNDARGQNELWVNRNDSDGEFAGVRMPPDYGRGAMGVHHGSVSVHPLDDCEAWRWTGRRGMRIELTLRYGGPAIERSNLVALQHVPRWLVQR